MAFQKVAKLSQQNNIFITQCSDKKVYISSTDGLNITNGLETRIYRPGRYNLVGNNIQSEFYEDKQNRIYFTTYRCLHQYDRAEEKFTPIFITGESGGVLTTDFTILDQQDSILFIRTSENITLYNTLTNDIQRRVPIDISDYQIADIHISPVDTNLVVASHEQVLHFSFRHPNQTKLLLENLVATSLELSTFPIVWMGTDNGEILAYHVENEKILLKKKVSNRNVRKIKVCGNHLMILLAAKILFYDPYEDLKVKEIKPFLKNHLEPIREMSSCYLDRDSILWISVDGKGVYFGSIRTKKFTHWIGHSEYKDKNNTTGILYQNHSFYILTRDGGIHVLDETGQPASNYQKIQNSTSNSSIITGIFYDENHILYSEFVSLHLLNIHTGEVQQLTEKTKLNPQYYFQIKNTPEGKILCSTISHGLVDIRIEGNEFHLIPIGDTLLNDNDLTYFAIDSKGVLYISKDEKQIYICSQTNGAYNLIKTLPVSGGLSSLTELSDSLIYITNTQGIFMINPQQDYAVERVLDSNKILAQHIYCVLPDTQQNLWITSNNGILRYSPHLDYIHNFSLEDGLQGLEYNTHAYFIADNNTFVVGGTHGINTFNPYAIKLSDYTPEIDLTSVRINDVDIYSTEQRIQDSKLVLPFADNTLSFEFYAIDYTDPRNTKTKFQLRGIDPNFVESNSLVGFARYPNIPAGNYTFSMMAANTDGVWNEKSMDIQIVINPPYWQTWWFRLLALVTIGILIYLGFRAYMIRQMEKKDLLLKRQALIIEKQEAIERERTRIAAEMHDDLGAGLTTIKFLSEKALKRATDPGEKEEITKISQYSKSIVQKMSEIIWAMNSKNDTIGNFKGYLRLYISKFLGEHQIPYQINSRIDNEKMHIGGEARRNLYLISKELLHNSVKYSQAEKIEIEMIQEDGFQIHIFERGGVGFKVEDVLNKGNGIHNMKQRMDKINGTITYRKLPEGMRISLLYPNVKTT